MLKNISYLFNFCINFNVEVNNQGDVYKIFTSNLSATKNHKLFLERQIYFGVRNFLLPQKI